MEKIRVCSVWLIRRTVTGPYFSRSTVHEQNNNVNRTIIANLFINDDGFDWQSYNFFQSGIRWRIRTKLTPFIFFFHQNLKCRLLGWKTALACIPFMISLLRPGGHFAAEFPTSAIQRQLLFQKTSGACLTGIGSSPRRSSGTTNKKAPLELHKPPWWNQGLRSRVGLFVMQR